MKNKVINYQAVTIWWKQEPCFVIFTYHLQHKIDLIDKMCYFMNVALRIEVTKVVNKNVCKLKKSIHTYDTHPLWAMELHRTITSFSIYFFTQNCDHFQGSKIETWFTQQFF